MNRRPKIDCKIGCSFCCYNMKIPVYEGETKTVSAITKAIIERKVNPSGLEPMFPGNKKRVPCPMLSDSSECVIYEDRPLACQDYASTDAKACERTLHEYIYRSTDINNDPTVVHLSMYDEKLFRECFEKTQGNEVDIRVIVKKFLGLI